VVGVFAERCGLQVMAASKCLHVQGAPQSTRHPAVVYWRRFLYAGRFFMLGSGHMQLRNELLYFLCVGVMLGCWTCIDGMLLFRSLTRGIFG